MHEVEVPLLDYLLAAAAVVAIKSLVNHLSEAYWAPQVRHCFRVNYFRDVALNAVDSLEINCSFLARRGIII